jgi:hypothetical protein
VEGARVEEKAEARADIGRAQVGDVAFDEAHLDASLGRVGARPLKRLLDELDGRYLPAASGEPDRPDPAAGAEVERRPVRRAPCLLGSDSAASLSLNSGCVAASSQGWKPIR